MNSSTNPDSRGMVSLAMDSTTAKRLRDTCPISNPVNSEALESPPTPSPEGQYIKTEGEARKIVQDLKLRLNCERAKCGSRTKTTGKPCEHSLNEHNIMAANAIIESLVTLTQSSSNLEVQLLKLANVVHCRQHANKGRMQQRVNDWLMAFPPGDNKTEPAMSVAKKIEEILLKKASNRCLGKARTNRYCLRRLGGQKVQNYQKTINVIVKPDTYLDDSELHYFLEVLQHNSFCSYHVYNQGAEQVAKWKLIIMDLRSESVIPRPDLNISLSSNGGTRLATTTNLHMDTSSSNMARRHSKTLSPDQFWPEEYDNTAFEIVTKPTETGDNELPFQSIQRIQHATLEKTDQAKGYVYAYEVKGNKGFVKIGFTSKCTIEERLSEWTRDCNRLVLPIYPTDPRTAVAVPYAARVEALCHAELRHCNELIYCNACLKQHLEWFQVTTNEAIAVIQKWSNWMWMQPLPYPPSLDLAPDTRVLVKEEDKH
ncbi:T5orf172 domain-containing protein [Aspergillus pseudodeflectus]|uniref:T5orf172 domain-containing protein n=1 Tax=Aspergillus pseudodeflectus TaxID=176178 RepID=A0ABR4KIX4_9EURO